jgi:hypothetical protein
MGRRKRREKMREKRRGKRGRGKGKAQETNGRDEGERGKVRREERNPN